MIATDLAAFGAVLAFLAGFGFGAYLVWTKR